MVLKCLTDDYDFTIGITVSESEYLKSAPSLSLHFILFSIKSMMSGISYVTHLEFSLNQVFYHSF